MLDEGSGEESLKVHSSYSYLPNGQYSQKNVESFQKNYAEMEVTTVPTEGYTMEPFTPNQTVELVASIPGRVVG